MLDTAIIRQDKDLAVELSRSAADWVLVRAIPTPLSLPVLLDIDPSVASSWKAGVQVELRLMRPKRAGDPHELEASRLSLAGSGGTGPAHGSLRADDDGRLSRRREWPARRRRFELFVRKMPPGRAFLVFAGLEQAIGDLLALAFDPDQIAEIRQWPAFRGVAAEVMDKVAATRFEGDVYAVPEGTVVFPGETLLRVVAPLPQAQWVETHLLASLAYPTLVASKAARIVQPRQGEGRSSSSAPGAATDRSPACWQRARP